MSGKDELPSTSTWGWYKEQIGVQSEYSFTSSSLLEQINTTKDTSDFLWYTTSIDIKEKLQPGEMKEVFLSIESLGHAALIFVNNKVIGFGYGNHDDANFTFNKKIKLSQGNNSLAVLSMMIGLQNYGPWFDIVGAGIISVFIIDINAKRDLSSQEWTYQVGLEGEYLGLHKLSLANSSLWTSGNDLPANQSLIWYKTSFIAPKGNGPLALNLASMGKGQAWVNGQSIGRYWSSYLAPSTGCNSSCDYRGSYDASKCLKNCGQPAQILYHVPRSWVHSGENLLVFHEELGGDPSNISVLTRIDQEICAHVYQSDPPAVDSWTPDSLFMSLIPEVRMSCEQGWYISSINFASFGTPTGQCGQLSHGTCHSQNTSKIVEEACVGREGCSIPISTAVLGDPCPGMLKSLAVEALCSQ
ncbi:Beta-galactosidase [Thalictrum thalictroides]|uniref:beta-galactosidase n=1 Tax=Thalictrum thalictroides TaxID=46969 RepID=A0A7J6VDX9_THATH|nr:Beta-galactosidase [Thalictrum thalictroides]